MTTLKLLVVGDHAVGRSKLLMAWSKGQSLDSKANIYDTLRTYTKQVTVSGSTHEIECWDTPTEDRIRLRALNYPSTNCVIIVFAVDNLASFQYILEAPEKDRAVGARALIEEIQDILTDVPKILIGSKTDLDRKVSKDQALELQRTIGAAKYMEFNDKDWKAMESILNEAVGLAANHNSAQPQEGTIIIKPNDHQNTTSCCVII